MHYKTRSQRIYGQSFERIPEDKEGNLYYLRLKTPLGPFYKLGFTTMPSVREGFAFQNNGHEQQIDIVLGFVEAKNALSIEKTLHGHFQHKAPFLMPEKWMPFFGNGQSELYVEDILGMDEDYTPIQASCVHAKVMEARMRCAGNSDAAIEAALNEKKNFDEDFKAIVGIGACWPMNWLTRCCLKIEDLLFTSGSEKANEARAQALIRWFRDEVIAQQQKAMNQRHERAKRLAALEKELLGWSAETEAAKRQKAQVEQDSRDVELKFEKNNSDALASIKNRDRAMFEQAIDVDRFSFNLAEAMTSDLVFASDYMIIANNCGLVDLVDAMHERGPRDLLMNPVQENYKALLHHRVTYHELLTEELVMPPDPVFYRTYDGTLHDVSPISTGYFDPAHYLESFGREWTLPERASRSEDGWVEHDVRVQNATSGFSGDLIVRATPMHPSGQIELSFPNFLDLYERANDVLEEYKRAANPDAPDLMAGLAKVRDHRPSPEEKAMLR